LFFCLVLTGFDARAQDDNRRNLRDERCQLTELRGLRAPVERRIDITCAGWELPSGSILQLRRAPSADLPGDLKSALGAPPLRDTLAGCEAPEARPSSGGQLAIAACRSTAENIPIAVVAARAGGDLLVGAGVASNLNLVIEGMTRIAAGGGATRLPSQAEAIRQLEERLGGKLPGARVADIGRLLDLKQLALSYNLKKEYRNALLLFQQLEQAAREIFGEGDPFLGDVLTNQALQQFHLGQFEAMRAVLARAEALTARSANWNDERRRLSVAALAAGASGDHGLADSLSGQAVRASRDARANEALGHSLLLRALHLDRSFPQEAEDALDEAATALRASAGLNHALTATALERLSLRRLQNGRVAEATSAARDAVAARTQLYGDSFILGETHYLLGMTLLAAGDAAQALAEMQKGQAFMLADRYGDRRLSAAHAEAHLKAAFAIGGNRTVINIGERGFPEAFRALQHVQSGDVSGAVRALAARRAAGAEGDLVRRLQDATEANHRARQRLTRIAHLGLEGPAVDELRARLLATLSETAQTYRSAELRLQQDFPRYAGLISLQLATAEDTTALLRPGERLAAFVSVAEDIFVALLGPGVARLVRLPGAASEATRLVAALRRSVDWAGATPTPFDEASARRLWQLLTSDGAVGAEIERAERLLLVANDPLLSIPFSLVLPPARTSLPIAVAPSIDAFVYLRKAPQMSRRAAGYFAVADPAFGGVAAPGEARRSAPSGCLGGSGRIREAIAALPGLPETRQEAEAIARNFPPQLRRIVAGQEATKMAMKTAPLGEYAVLSFGTHTLLPDEDCVERPGLALTPGRGDGPDDNGLLDATDVMALRLNAEIVILAACNTAGGDDFAGGSSLTGLARAFIYAGARSVLATHWNVFSRPTAELMSALFDGYAAGGPADDLSRRLSKAQDLVRGKDAYRHPIAWAAFTLIGD